MRRTAAAPTPRTLRDRWKHALEHLQGSTVVCDLRRYDSLLQEIARLEATFRMMADEEILRTSQSLRDRARAGTPLATLRPPLYALARESARRVLDQWPYDEQVLAALALDDGHVVEMQTGEGKTLSAVMPAALNAFADCGVHVLTFNDYLARRDAEWMGPVYRLLGVSVGCVQESMSPDARRDAYHLDVTYATAKEAGFDHLRDLMVMTAADAVHRSFHFALVDEADSILIDEATVPLVLAGSSEHAHDRATRLAEIVGSLAPAVHFTTDEYARSVELTDDGIAQVEALLGCGELHRGENVTLLSEINCALHARVLLRRDVDYIVRRGRIEVLDAHTGRVVVDRHWPDGLQSALEAKEGIERGTEGRILQSMTLQHFLQGYSKLCGMTGTARDAAAELHETYGRHVFVIPTHRPARRIDHDDVLFTHRDAKEHAIVEEVRLAHAAGRPVLVGTATVVESERFAERLRVAGVRCEVLNARNDAEEARIVANAGAIGAVTISTNMAGRGTDIRLGGDKAKDHDRVAALGGLYVIGSNRHESRRVDLQLRGRAGRQGDPGASRFFVSLEDDLLVRYGIGLLIPPRHFPVKSPLPLDNPVIRREVARVQRIVQGQNREIRRTLGRYAMVIQQQHGLLMERRRAALLGGESPDVWPGSAERRAWLVAAAGERAIADAERLVTLACIDDAWRNHLAFCADLREGIHLVRLGGEDPLTRFTADTIRAFAGIDERIDGAVLAALSRVTLTAGRIDLTATGLKTPSATWTYLVNDDPFRSRIGAMLTGPGGATLAMYSAAVLMPLLILWGLVEKRWRRRRVVG